VLATVGPRYEYDRFCSSSERDFTCGPQPEFPDAPRLFQDLQANDMVVRDSLAHSGDSYRDPRIRAVFAIAPVFGRGFTRADVNDIRIPIEMVAGLGDAVAPPPTNAQSYAALISGQAGAAAGSGDPLHIRPGMYRSRQANTPAPVLRRTGPQPSKRADRSW
jgi:predicted dienelactone hydrolase